MSDVIASGGGAVVVDLTDVDYIDSAGLGMLLNLRERAGKTETQITLTGAAGLTREALELASFDTLFAIDWREQSIPS